MKLLSAEQMRALDRHCIEELGIPALRLMERAGVAVAGGGAGDVAGASGPGAGAVRQGQQWRGRAGGRAYAAAARRRRRGGAAFRAPRPLSRCARDARTRHRGRRADRRRHFRRGAGLCRGGDRRIAGHRRHRPGARDDGRADRRAPMPRATGAGCSRWICPPGWRRIPGRCMGRPCARKSP